MIKIILVDDHHIVRKSLNMMMEKYPEIEVIADVEHVHAALKILEEGQQADILLSDIMMPEVDGIRMMGLLKERNLSIKVVLLSMLEDEKYAADAFAAGASAYLSKNIDVDELLFCLHHVIRGNRYVSSGLSISILERMNKKLNGSATPSGENLHFSDREILLLELIAEGQTNQEMADRLYLSRRTIESQRQNLIDKTGVKNTAALIRFAVLNGYIS